MSGVLTASNFLSLLRIPLAWAFLFQDVKIRLVVIALAMLTDWLDGFIARKYGSVSRVGAILDPITDKFFVMFVSAILVMECHMDLWQLGALVSRDLFLCLFAVYLWIFNRKGKVRYGAIWWGKVSTVVQFCALIGLTMNIIFPWYVFASFIVLGSLAYGELCLLATRLN